MEHFMEEYVDYVVENTPFGCISAMHWLSNNPEH